MEILLNISFYIMGAMLILPYIIALGWGVRLVKVERSAALLLIPSASLGLLVGDLWFLGEPGCLALYSFACDAIAIVGWLFYLPVFAILFTLSLSALGIIIPATVNRWRK